MDSFMSFADVPEEIPDVLHLVVSLFEGAVV
jgi:hypothetical protein